MVRKQKVYWSWEPISDTFLLSSNFCDLTDMAEEDIPQTIKEAQALFSTDDLSAFINLYGDVCTERNTSLLQVITQYPPLQKAEKPIQLKWTGEVLRRDENGRPLLVAGSVKKFNSTASDTTTVEQKAFFFDKLMRKIPDSIYFKDLDSRFLLLNEACAAKFGFDDSDAVIGKSDFDFFDNEHAQEAFDDEQRIITTQKPLYNKVEREGELNHDGTVRWASTTKLPLFDKDGDVMGTFGITRDISDQKNAEVELKEKEVMLNKLSEQIPGFFFLIEQTPEGWLHLPFISQGIQEIFELSPHEVGTKIQPIYNRVLEKDRNAFTSSISRSIKELKLWRIDFRVNLPKQGLRWLRGRARPDLQPDGSVHGIGYISDITDEKKNLEDAVRLRKQLQAVFDSAPNLIFIKDVQGKYLMANKAAAAFFGQSQEEIIGKTDEEIGIPKEKAKQFLKTDKKVIETNSPIFQPEDSTTLADGSSVWHQTIKVPFPTTDSGRPAVLSIVTDVTERKHKETELNHTLDIIGEQNKRLMNFAHIVSHNLRNHAGNISMLLSLYDMEESEEEQKELLQHLNTASKRLNDSISDLNEIIDQQYNTQKDHVEINLKETITKIQEILTTEILANNVAFNIDIPDDFTIEYNPAYIESILLNLISNGIKYRQPDVKPVIDIKAWRQKEHIGIQVSDNGLGIDLDKYGEKLFGMYNTFHGNENSKGIGLFITKNQIESLGGSIEVESEPGKGSTFKITLK
jgi:PAS domain S-box-containing protein